MLHKTLFIKNTIRITRYKMYSRNIAELYVESLPQQVQSRSSILMIAELMNIQTRHREMTPEHMIIVSYHFRAPNSCGRNVDTVLKHSTTQSIAQCSVCTVYLFTES